VAEFDLSATMDGIGTALTNSGLVPNVYAYPVESVSVPCALVDYPTGKIELSVTFGGLANRADHIVIPVFYLVGLTGTKDGRDALSAAMHGATDLVRVLEGASPGDMVVTDGEIAQVKIGEATYLGLKFSLDILT
jgi:hypothetical protein